MDWLETIYSQITTYIEIPYLLILVLISYLIKKEFEDFLSLITGHRWRTVYTVLIISTLTGIAYYFAEEVTVMKLFVTYAVGTSLHDLIFRWLEKKING